MKTKFWFLTIFSLLLAVGISGCSKNEPDPEDYISSILTGEYKKDGLLKLYVTENSIPLNDYGYVRFDSKHLEEGDFKFVNVIPGESTKEFKNIPLKTTESGIGFTIEYTRMDKPIIIAGTIVLGEMRVDIKD